MPTKKATKDESTLNKKDQKIELIKQMHKTFTGKYFYANGKRKTSIAKVRLYEKWKGKILVNWIKAEDYFTPVLIEMINAPLKLVWNEWDFDITIKVIWWWSAGQASAIRHWISKALLVFDLEKKSTLKKQWHITRDSRKKERKKPGLKRARKAPTWVKR